MTNTYFLNRELAEKVDAGEVLYSADVAADGVSIIPYRFESCTLYESGSNPQTLVVSRCRVLH